MERVRPVLLSNDSQRPSEPLLCGRAKMAGARLRHTGGLGPQDRQRGATVPCDVGQTFNCAWTKGLHL